MNIVTAGLFKLYFITRDNTKASRFTSRSEHIEPLSNPTSSKISENGRPEATRDARCTQYPTPFQGNNEADNSPLELYR